MYCAPFDVRNALTPGAVTGGNDTASSLTDEQILDAIAEADARISTYLPAGYTVPMVDTTIPVVGSEPPATSNVRVAHNVFRFWSRDIAAYLATLTFKRNKDVSENDPVRLRYNAAMTDLTAVAKGQLQLPPDDDATDDGEGEVSVYNQYEGQMFGLDDFGLTSSPGRRVYDRRIHDGGW